LIKTKLKELLDILEVLAKISTERAIKEHLNKLVNELKAEGVVV